MRRILWVVLGLWGGALAIASCSEKTVTTNADIVDPVARMVYPTSTAEAPMDVSDSMNVYVAAKDNVGVARVELWSLELSQSAAQEIGTPLTQPLDPSLVPDSLRQSDGSGMYKWTWRTGGIQNGTEVRLFARVYDRAGNNTRSAPSEIRVINAQERRPPRPTIIVVDPASREGTTQTPFVFDASATQDDVYPPNRVQVRWDFNGDGVWERNWDQNLVATDRVTYTYPLLGTYTVVVEARNDYLPDQTGRASIPVVVTNVGGRPAPPEPANMLLVPAGSYFVGADTASQPFANLNERPLHQVNLTVGFHIERTEVTNRLFLAYLSTAMVGQHGWPPKVLRQGKILMLFPNRVDPVEPDSIPEVLLDTNNSAIFYDGDRDIMTVDPTLLDDPVVGVSWYGAKAYCENFGLRLPTEHEWEIAAKGDSASFAYPWGYTISLDMANYRDLNGGGYNALRPRGSYPTFLSPFGLLDVVGNAAEWVKDWYGSYSGDVQTNPEGPLTGTTKVIRGGSYRQSAFGVRVTARAELDPTLTSSVTGFRTAFTDTTSH